MHFPLRKHDLFSNSRPPISNMATVTSKVLTKNIVIRYFQFIFAVLCLHETLNELNFTSLKLRNLYLLILLSKFYYTNPVIYNKWKNVIQKTQWKYTFIVSRSKFFWFLSETEKKGINKFLNDGTMQCGK